MTSASVPRAEAAVGPALRVVEWSDGAAWDGFVGEAPDSTVMHLWGWKAIMERAYGHRTVFLAAVEGDTLLGVLPLTLMRSLALGRHLVSMPFMDYGGACTSGREKAEAALVEAAMEVADRERAVLSLRYLDRRELQLPCSLERVTMWLELGTSEDALWRRLPSERRNRIRKGQKHGLIASVHGPEALAPFFGVFAANMRDLGSPVHSRGFFREVLAQMGDHARIILVRLEDRPVGAGLMLLYRRMISIPWVSSLRAYFDKCPNQVLYWEAMRFGIANTYSLLDLGRSARDSGTYEAKRQWGAEPVQLHWCHYPPTAAPPEDGVRRLGWVARLWQRLPLAVANTIGPRLRGAIPN